jgi:7-keto-8-aminopelargonate synthetase-like enzyme
MPKALSGEMLADPVVLIDRRQHHSFKRRVKALGAQSTRFARNSLQHIAATYGELEEGISSDARSRRSC